jgi:hypothetical protein
MPDEEVQKVELSRRGMLTAGSVGILGGVLGAIGWNSLTGLFKKNPNFYLNPEVELGKKEDGPNIFLPEWLQNSHEYVRINLSNNLPSERYSLESSDGQFSRNHPHSTDFYGERPTKITEFKLGVISPEAHRSGFYHFSFGFLDNQKILETALDAAFNPKSASRLAYGSIIRDQMPGSLTLNIEGHRPSYSISNPITLWNRQNDQWDYFGGKFEDYWFASRNAIENQALVNA